MNILYDERVDGALPKVDKAALLAELQAQLPDLDILHRSEDLKPYECDGLSAYRAIAAGAAAHLAPGGRLLVEIGAGQGQAVRELFSAQELDVTGVRSDLDGRNRVICAATRFFR